MNGPKILKQCKKAYAALKTYTGDTMVRTRQEDHEGRVEYDERSSAHVIFERPDRIRVNGTLSGADPTGFFDFISRGGETWERWSKKPTWKPAESINMSIAGFTGVSGQSATVIPAVLTRSSWGDPFPVDSGEVERTVVPETIERKTLYRVSAQSETTQTTFWIDPDTMLLARLRQRVELAKLEASTKKLEASIQKAIRPGATAHEVRETITTLRGVMDTLHEFENVSINTTVSEVIFALPGG